MPNTLVSSLFSAATCGISRACIGLVAERPAAKTHTELETWKLANELRRLILNATRHGDAAKDFKFREQMRDAVRSACRNTAEGFYRYGHAQFGHMLTIAYASLGEVLDCIQDGLDSEYFSEELATEMRSLANRAMAANLRLRQSWTRRGGRSDKALPREPR
jgi:four helix bundle protein